MNSKLWSSIITLGLFVSLVAQTGCRASPAKRQQFARGLALKSDFVERDIGIGSFLIRSYERFDEPSSKMVRIYIEGDGLAWLDKHRQSPDPTPTDPIALRLACADTYPNVAYLARPSQYTGAKFEDRRLWGSDRFSPEVVQAMNASVEDVRTRFGALEVELVGYSGGAAIAILVANQRHDVTLIRTVAGNLDTEVFCNYHKVDPLDNSKNPAEVGKNVAHVRQLHFVGANDDVVPVHVARSYLDKGGVGSIVQVENADHEKGWEQRWPHLLASYP